MIRDIRHNDKEQWEVLYKGYADFYKVEMNAKILKTVWEWIHDKNHEVSGLAYEKDNKIIGIAHYRKMPSPLRGKYIGFLDDLYVDPKYRRNGIGEKMIKELNVISRKHNSSAPWSPYSLAVSTGSPASLRLTKFTPFTTLP